MTDICQVTYSVLARRMYEIEWTCMSWKHDGCVFNVRNTTKDAETWDRKIRDIGGRATRKKDPYVLPGPENGIIIPVVSMSLSDRILAVSAEQLVVVFGAAQDWAGKI